MIKFFRDKSLTDISMELVIFVALVTTTVIIVLTVLSFLFDSVVVYIVLVGLTSFVIILALLLTSAWDEAIKYYKKGSRK